MSVVDWTIVFVLNAAIFGYGLFLARGTRSTTDWFLAGRGLPWWIVGLSMFATGVDSGDYVAVNGETYQNGLSMLSNWWIGLVLGWILAAFFVLPPMYRSGIFTNAEWLESRFSPAMRFISALVQLQYRTNVLANITWSLFLTFKLVAGWGNNAWFVVVAIAAGAAIYTALGGLKAVALTDVLQSLAMLAASLVLWGVLWHELGGWSGLEKELAEYDQKLPDQVLKISGYRPDDMPAVVVMLGWVIIAVGYCIVNHTQSMRMFGARSLWDLRMSILAAGGMTLLLMFFNLTVGVMGRGIYPDPQYFETPDDIFPTLVKEFLHSGLKGVVVAGLLAAAFSTYDSIGSSLAAVFTRDVYARLLVRDRQDSHYLWVSRLMTPAIIALSFAYIPFLGAGMLKFFVRATSVFVTPLLTVYLMGSFTRVHRKSGVVGLCAGVSYGLAAFLGSADELLPEVLQKHFVLPHWLCNEFVTYLWSLGITSTAMVLVTLYLGPTSVEDLRHEEPPGWLRRSREAVAELAESPFALQGRPMPLWARPGPWAALLLAVACLLVFVVFW